MASTTVLTKEQVAEHSTEADCWVVIGNAKTGGPKVYNVTKFLDSHPGGGEVITEYAGGVVC